MLVVTKLFLEPDTDIEYALVFIETRSCFPPDSHLDDRLRVGHGYRIVGHARLFQSDLQFGQADTAQYIHIFYAADLPNRFGSLVGELFQPP